MSVSRRAAWSIVLGLCFAFVGSGQTADGPFPPNAKPGECYARVFLPAVYRDVAETIVERERFETFAVIPARFEEAEQRLLVEEAYERIEVVPAKFEWVEEKVLVKPAAEVVVETPALFELVEERVIDEPAHNVWKAGEGVLERIDNDTGEVLCLVEVPATYKTVTKRVLTRPAETRTVEIPAQYQVIRKRVTVEPMTTRRVKVPARYQTLKVMREVHPAEIKKVVEPARTRAITRRRKVAEGRLAWRQVVCETNLTLVVVAEIQSALRDAGEDPGPIDGVIGLRTVVALRAFQDANDLPHGHLTIAVLRSLGIDPAELAAGERSLRQETGHFGKEAVRELQTSLRSRGHNSGPIDGVIGPQTLLAMHLASKSPQLGHADLGASGATLVE